MLHNLRQLGPPADSNEFFALVTLTLDANIGMQIVLFLLTHGVFNNWALTLFFNHKARISSLIDYVNNLDCMQIF